MPIKAPHCYQQRLYLFFLLPSILYIRYIRYIRYRIRCRTSFFLLLTTNLGNENARSIVWIPEQVYFE
jgi:hypothetical protein